jgi:peptidoglycan hydrolase-like protein with peptidoglycan-binding domain
VKRRNVILTASAIVVAAGGGIAVTAAAGGGDDSAAAVPGLPKATGTVTRGDLIDTETVDGALGYGDEQLLVAGASGTVTWLPGTGATIRRGKTLYGLNSKPVTLMYGTMPMYRGLSEGVRDGTDVEQLERNLAALGYGDSMTVDGHFTAATAKAVENWQDDRGLSTTGVIDSSQIIFAPGAVRVTGLPVTLGGRTMAAKPVLKVTGTERQVKVNLDTANQQLARKGAKISVELPDHSTASGKISKVGTVAIPKNSGGNAGSSPATDSTIEVDITLDDPDKAGSLDQAPVSVDLQSERHKDVLSVPVEALLALREGGYGVQVVAGGAVHVVSVQTGLYAGGRVEVSAQGLSEGIKVGVPSK